jgi:F0F1-type ATP synthase assembly protein I
MSNSTKPALHTPTSPRSGADASKNLKSDSAQASASLAIDMGWKMLLAVVLPLLLGRYLDAHSNGKLTFTIIGLVIGVAGMIVVVVQTVRQLNEINGTNVEDKE